MHTAITGVTDERRPFRPQRAWVVVMTCDDDAMRTIIELPEDQLEALDALCRRDSISRAEAIRRAVGAMIQSRRPAERERAFGLWRGRGEDGLAYQRRARNEWVAVAGTAGLKMGITETTVWSQRGDHSAISKMY